MKNSIIKNEYLRYLEDDKIKVVSFDIFDTLVFRKSAQPSDIFYNIGQNSFVQKLFYNPLNFQQLRIAAEKKARENSNKEISLLEIYRSIVNDDKTIEQLIKIEIEEEKKVILINKEILEWIEIAKAKNKEIIFISDIYLSKEQIKYLIFSKLDIKDYKLFISSDLERTKKSGNLYNYVLNSMNINKEELFHIGDNIYSHIQNANKLGISSLLYNVPNYLKEILLLEQHYVDGNNFRQLNKYRVLSALNNPYKEDDKSFFYNLGSTHFAPIIWDFCLWLKNIYDNGSFKQINFIMREGRIFYKFFKILFPEINVNLIFASRKSTFLASLDEKDIENNKFQFIGFEEITIENLYALYGIKINQQIIDVKDFRLIRDQYNNEEQDEILNLVKEDFISQKEQILVNIKDAKNNIKQYFKDLNFKKKSIFVEFGGNGTIPRNIQKIIKTNNKSLNVLFYTHSKGLKNMLKHNMVSFLPYSSELNSLVYSIQKTPIIMEILFNGNYGTTLSYRKTGDEAVPILQNFDKNSNQSKLIDVFDEGIESFFNILKKYKMHDSLLACEESLKLICRLIEVPTFKEVKYLGNLIHESGHGSDYRFKILEENKTKELFKNRIESVYKDYLKGNVALKNIFWIEGYITLIEKDYISTMLGYKKNQNNFDIIDYLRNQIITLNISKISIYGIGEIFDKIEPILIEMGIKIEYIFDSKAKADSFYIKNYRVQHIDNVIINNDSVIFIASIAFKKEIENYINTYAQKRKIFIHCI